MFAMPHVKQYHINNNSSKEAAEKLSMSEISFDSEIKYDSEANYSDLPPEHYHKIFEKTGGL